MTDLSNRFAKGDDKQAPRARADDLDRLSQTSPARAADANGWIAYLKRRTDLVAAVCAFAAAGLVIWPQLHPSVVHLPPVAETGEDMATVKVHPLWDNGVAAMPDWYGLFDAYQLETSLRDISIRCNYGLPTDGRVDRYLHARLEPDATIHIFLADPGTCPKT
jgi:hypothetical protein